MLCFADFLFIFMAVIIQLYVFAGKHFLRIASSRHRNERLALALPDVCRDRLDWSVISINEINYKENWVFFDLRQPLSRKDAKKY